MANKMMVYMDRIDEAIALTADIEKVQQRLDKAEDFELKLAYKKLLIVLKEWRKRGY